MPALARSAPKPQQLWRLADAAEYAGVCKTTLRNWIAAGLITGHRRGPKLIFVDLAEIDAMTGHGANAQSR